MGCGPGAYIPSLKTFCDNITAIDLSPEFIEIISRSHADVKSYLWDLNNGLKNEIDTSFDLVISPLTIHYVKDLEKLFSEVNRVLKANGVFVFSTHHPFLDFEDSISKNYFETEYLTQMWDTLPNRETEVSFFRRPLSATLGALFSSGFVLENFSEGKPSDKINDVSKKHYQQLSTKPQFIFVRARKK